jgi:membrane-associated protease RseP (regulator of RpoE activity)
VSFRIRSNLGYVTALAVASGVILVLGIVLRPKHTPAPAISEAERAQLQDLAQRQSLQRRTIMLAGYARELSVAAARVLQQPDTVSYGEPRPGEMLIVVSVADSGDPHWITVEFAGHSSVKCGGETLTQLDVDAVIPQSLTRAAVFTLNENVVGAITRCEDRLIVTDPKNYSIAARAAADQRYVFCCGVRLSDAANNVSEMRVGSVLERAGVEVGDRILTVNGQGITSPDLLEHLIAAPQVVVEVERSGRNLTLRYEAKPIRSGALLARSREGTSVVEVQAGTAAARRGLQPGDIVIRAGDVRKPKPVVVDQTLAAADGTPIVITRGDRRMLLEPSR